MEIIMFCVFLSAVCNAALLVLIVWREKWYHDALTRIGGQSENTEWAAGKIFDQTKSLLSVLYDLRREEQHINETLILIKNGLTRKTDTIAVNNRDLLVAIEKVERAVKGKEGK